MKKSKIIIPALAMLVMSTAATVTGTVAWFTMNTTAYTEGMVVAAKTSGSLIIKEAKAQNAAYPLASDRGTKVVFNSTGHQFYPSTIDWTQTTLHTHSNVTGLKFVTNGQEINYETGTKKNKNVTLDYDWVLASADANGESNTDYYFDYGVFLCGDGLALDAQDLKISLSATIGNAGNPETFGEYGPDVTPNPNNDDINAAISVAFYGQYIDANDAARATVSGSTYIGSLNLAQKANGVSDPVDHLDWAGGGNTPAGIDIPKSGTGEAYAITMRVYYDGALIKSLKTETDPDLGTTVDNDYAKYSEASGSPESGILYYSDNQGTIVNPGTSVNGLYKVDTTNSTVLFARSIDVANIRNMKLDLKFETTNHR